MTSFYEELHKSDRISDESENVHSREKVDKWIFGLLLFLIGFMPLIVMANVEEVISPLISNIDILSSSVKGDLFTHYKALLILVVTVVTSAMLIVKILFMGGTIRKTYINYVLGIFVVAIVISTIASPNITIALNGQYNRSDGAISWLCYVALMFIAMNIEYPKKVVSYIMYTMMPFVFINLYIITMNFYGKDLLVNNAWMQSFVSLFLPEGANITEGSVLVGTLNQWNYMSGMFAMMTVMYLTWAVTSKKWHENIVGAVTASAAILVVLMAVSKSGFLTFIVLTPLIIVVIFRVEKKIQAVSAFCIFIVVITPIFNVLAEKDQRIWDESIGLFIPKNPYFNDVISIFNIEKKAYATGILELPELPERSWSAGSGRTYIWQETLNLIEARPLLGYGSDTLIYSFPHYNINSRAGLWDENTITDKPHSTFIGVFFGVGLLGFIAIVTILIKVALNSIKTILTKRWDAFVLSITGLAYFAQSVFNDSLPATSAWSFIIIGIMLSLIYTNQEESLGNGRKDRIA